MRAILASISGLTIATGGVGFLPTSLLPRLSSMHVGRARFSLSSNHDLAMNARDGSTTSSQDGGGEMLLTRKGLLQAATAAVAIGVGIASSPGSASAAADGGPKGLPASGYFVQHAVFKVPDMDEEVKFFTEGLGMKVVRQREVNGARNVFVAYGEETLANKDGGYFSLELVFDPKSPPGYSSGGAFQYLGLTLPSTLAMVAYKVDAAGGTVVPHWFGTKDFVEVTSPSGTTVRIKEGKRRDPFSLIGFATQSPDKATAYFHDVLGMKEQDAGLLKVLGPLAGDALRLSGYDKGGVSVALNPVDSKIFEGGAFKKLAILTKDTKGVADKVSASGGAKKIGGDVLFAGEVPGIGTKVANTIDFEGRGVVFVDYDDFEGEMKPPSSQENS